MKTSDNNGSNKRTYLTPEVACILLDNEISLQLQSATPPNSGDEVNNAPNYINSNPFKTEIA